MRSKQTGLTDDLNDLGAFCESMQPGEITVISGAAGVGKTTLAMRIAQIVAGADSEEVPERAKRVLAFAPKHPTELFVRRGFCRRRIYIDDFSHIDFESIDRRTRTMAKMFGVDLLIVDTMQDVCENDKEISMSEGLASLRGMAEDLSIPIIIVSERADTPFCDGVCMPTMNNLVEAADVAICLRRNSETGTYGYCMSRKVERIHPGAIDLGVSLGCCLGADECLRCGARMLKIGKA